MSRFLGLEIVLTFPIFENKNEQNTKSSRVTDYFPFKNIKLVLAISKGDNVDLYRQLCLDSNSNHHNCDSINTARTQRSVSFQHNVVSQLRMLVNNAIEFNIPIDYLRGNTFDYLLNAQLTLAVCKRVECKSTQHEF